MTRAALPSVAPKLAKLLPLLASDRDGEVLGAVVAIRRTLATAGLDLHDLASAMTVDRAPRSIPERGAPMWRTLNFEQRIAWLSVLRRSVALSPWEHRFVSDTYDRVRRNPAMGLSGRQAGIVNGLLAKAWAEGGRP